MKINKKLIWLYILSASIYATQGFEGLPGLSLFFFLKEKLNFTPQKIMFIGSITSIAWLIKPLWGYLCDNFLSNKKWIILSLLGSISIALYFGLSSFIPLSLLVILLSLAGFNTALRDVSNDGLACIEGKESDTCNIFQNIQWTSITIAGIIVSLAGGYIADHFNYKFAYLCLIPIYLIIIGIILQYKTEPKNKTKRVPILTTIYSYKELFTNKPFLLGCLFIFLYNFNPSFGTPLTFIERDTFKWSGTFMGVLGAITSAISILGSVLYWKFNKKINLKKLLYFAILLGACTTLSYLYFTPVSAIVYSIVYSVIGMFVFLNFMTFMAESTISGKEATSFALLCSINNLAGTASSLAGAWLYPLVGLKFLIIISAFTSFICLPLIKHLKIK